MNLYFDYPRFFRKTLFSLPSPLGPSPPCLCGASTWVAASSAPRTVHVLTLRRHSDASSLGGGGSAASPTFHVAAVLQCPSHVQLICATDSESFVVGGRCGRLWCIDVKTLLSRDNGAASSVILKTLSSADAVAEFAGLRVLAACLTSNDATANPSEAASGTAAAAVCSVVASGLISPVACLTLPHRPSSTTCGLATELQPYAVPVSGLGRGQPPASFLLVLARESQPSDRLSGHSGDVATRSPNPSSALMEG